MILTSLVKPGVRHPDRRARDQEATVRVVELVFLVLFAIAGYQEARRFARQTGRTPWGWSPWAWAILLGLFFIIGIILLAIAERQGRSRVRQPAAYIPTGYPPQQAGYPPPPPVYPPPGYPPSVYPPQPTTSGYIPDSTTILPNP
jgi:hypothetical protein